MAKKQTRRSLSLSRATYDAAVQAAAARGIATSQWVTELIRAEIPELPRQIHAGDPRPERDWKPEFRVALATHKMTAAEVAAAQRPAIHKMTAEQVRDAVIKAGTRCANCIEQPATHKGRVDRSGKIFPLCDGCELPSVETAR